MQVCAEENGGKPLLITFLNVQLEELFPGLRDAGRRQKPRWELLGGRPWVPSITRPTPPPAEVELWAEATEWLARGYRLVVADDGSRWPPKVHSVARGLAVGKTEAGSAAAYALSDAQRKEAVAGFAVRLRALARHAVALVRAGATFVYHSTPPAGVTPGRAGSVNSCFDAGVLTPEQQAAHCRGRGRTTGARSPST